MIAGVFVIFLGAATLIALANWRLGVPLAMVAGALQDPIRKLTPGAPVVFVLATIPIWGAVAFGALVRDRANWVTFKRDHGRLRRLMAVFLASLVIPTGLAFGYGAEAWRLALLGVFGYLSPLVGIVVGYSFLRSPAQLRRLMVFYSVLTAGFMVGTLLEYGRVLPDWPAIGTEALNAVWIRTTAEGSVRLISGFFRSPDIMGWHAATLVMLSLTLLLQRRQKKDRLWLLAVVWGIVCLLVGGRRKMVMMPLVWACTVGIVLVRAGGFRRVISLAFMGALIVLSVHFASGEMDVHESYYIYAGTVSSEGPERLFASVIGSVWTTYQQSGFLGKGIGTASQGVRYLGVADTETWQESGPAKVVVELGVPGLLCGLLLAGSLARECLRVLRRVAPGRPAGSLLVGTLALVVANAASFTISHQAYSDSLIMNLTCFFLGVVLAAPRWTEAADTVRAPARRRLRFGQPVRWAGAGREA